MALYRAYIPTHFREFVFPGRTQKQKPKQPPNQEAELEDAIINRYYRVIKFLIDQGVLRQTTHHFTCRDTEETRVHYGFARIFDGEYNYIDWHTGGLPATRTNDIHQSEHSLTEHLALQMVGRYGDMKSYRIVIPHIRGDGDLDVILRRQVDIACKFAISRDEIELFNALCSHNKKRTTELDIIFAQSLRCITHFLNTNGPMPRSNSVQEGGNQGWLEILCYRRRMDLLKWYLKLSRNSTGIVYYAVCYGFIELLEELYNENAQEPDVPIIPVFATTLRHGMTKDAIIRVMDWAHAKGQNVTDDSIVGSVIYNPFPELIDRLIKYGVLSERLIATMMSEVVHLVARHGIPSVEFNEWKACVDKLISMGIPIPVVPLIKTCNLQFAKIANGIGGLRIQAIYRVLT